MSFSLKTLLLVFLFMKSYVLDTKLSQRMTKAYKLACALSKDSDQPRHPPSLISLRCWLEESLGPYYSLRAQKRL